MNNQNQSNHSFDAAMQNLGSTQGSLVLNHVGDLKATFPEEPKETMYFPDDTYQDLGDFVHTKSDVRFWKP